MYLISSCAHQTGQGFDAVFVKVSFVLFFGFSVFQMINDRKFSFNSMIAWYVIFLFYGYLSVLWAKSTSNAIYYTNTFIQMLGCIICITNRIKNYDDIDKYLKLIIFALLYSSIVLFIKTPFGAWGTERIGLDIGLHPNAVGFRFSMGVLISIYFALVKKKYFYYIFGVLFEIIILFSGSRKGLIMSIMAISLYPVLFLGRKKKTGKDLIRFIIIIFLLFTALVIIYYLVMNVEIFYNVIGHRFESWIDDNDASIDGREFFVKKGIELFKSHPIIGYGMNNFSSYMKEINYSHITYSHNNFIEILSTLGIIGFAIYYSMIFSISIKGIKLFVKNKSFIAQNLVLLLLFLIDVGTSWWGMPYLTEFSTIIYTLAYMSVRINLEEKINEKNTITISKT